MLTHPDVQALLSGGFAAVLVAHLGGSGLACFAALMMVWWGIGSINEAIKRKSK